jgi:quercetin dioxygenase-like cupin family protein
LVQKITRKQSIFIVNESGVPVEDMAKMGAEKVKVRYLVDERHGSDNFALRLYTIGRGGHTPLDQHAYEHQVYVLSGRGLLRHSEETESSLRTLQAGDTIFIPSNAIHQFSNELDEPFVFLCVKGNPTLYSSNGQTTAPDDTQRNYC